MSSRPILIQFNAEGRTLLALDLSDVRLQNPEPVPLTLDTADGQSATVSFEGGGIEIRLTPQSAGISRLEAVLSADSGTFSRLGLRLRYLPDAEAAWEGCRDSFHWLPNIKQSERQFAGDHVFRSPAAVLTSAGELGVALVPDLELLGTHRPLPQYLDMGFPDGDAPWIEWGFSAQEPAGHVYYQPTDTAVAVPPEGARLAAYLLHGETYAFPATVNRFLWSLFGSRLKDDPWPLVMRPATYASYGYDAALPRLWRAGPEPDTGGITNSTFLMPDGHWSGRAFGDDLWFQSWFNNARTAWGLAKWAQWQEKPDWAAKSRAMMRLALAAPAERGLTPAIYAPQDGGWKASDAWLGGKSLFHLPDAAWTGLWIGKFHREIEPLPGTPERLQGLTEFFLSAQDPDGGLPTWVSGDDLAPDPRLRGAACGAMALWFLGEELLAGAVAPEMRGRAEDALRRGVSHLRERCLPHLRFEDFELYFSCSPKPLDFFDPWTQSYGVSTLAVQWCAEAFRVAHRLGVSGPGEADLESGLFCLEVLCLFQQVWNPPYLSLYAFGGFGVMNTDGEWHDARQAQFAETLANWAEITGRAEYRERAVAAARASLALMVCEENKDICPNNYRGVAQQDEVHGMMAENYGHDGVDKRSYQSSFHWGSGSALTTAARLLVP